MPEAVENYGHTQREHGDPADLTFTMDVEDAQVLGKLIEDYYYTDTFRNDRHLAWQQQILFYNGKQYLRRSFEGFEIVPVTRHNRGIPRPVINRIRVECDALIANLTGAAPAISVDPNSDELEDKNAAALGEIILDAKEMEDLEPKNRELLAAWGVMSGNAFKKTTWDSQHGPHDERGPLGDTRTEVCSPFSISVNPQASCDEDAEWIMEAYPRTFNWIRTTYGRKGAGYTNMAHLVRQESTYSEGVQRLLSIRSLGELQNSWWFGNHEGVAKNSAIVKEWYQRPSPEFPKGRVCVVANGVLLYYTEDNPYYHTDTQNWHPFTHFKYLIIPGNYWGRTPMTDGVEIQKMINGRHALIEMNNRRSAVPQILNPRQAGVAKGAFSGKPGTIIDYKYNPAMPGAKPEILEGRGLSNQVYQELTILKDELTSIMGVHDVLKGDKVSGIRNYSSLALLKEEANRNLAPQVNRFERMIEKDAQQKLVLIERFYNTRRPAFRKYLKNKSHDINATMIEDFLGADLKGNNSVRVETNSIVPKSMAAKRAGLLEAAQYGLFPLDNPIDRARAAQIMDLEFSSYVDVHVKKAKWENSQMKKGVFLFTTDQWTDHQVHIEIHNQQLQDPSFYDLDEESQMIMIAHMEEHQKAYSEQQESQRQMALESFREEEQIKNEMAMAKDEPKYQVAREKIGSDDKRTDVERLKVSGEQVDRERDLVLRGQEVQKVNQEVKK